MSPIGYSTDFYGSVQIEPPLNEAEISYLKDLASTRRMARTKGPFYVRGTGSFGQDKEDDVLNYNQPDPSQPGLWCQWVPSDDGGEIAWDGNEKFYNAEEWMRYIVTTLLMRPPERRRKEMLTADQRFAKFTFDHVVNGVIEAQGEEPDDRWRLVVKDNVVTRVDPSVTWNMP